MESYAFIALKQLSIIHVRTIGSWAGERVNKNSVLDQGFNL